MKRLESAVGEETCRSRNFPTSRIPPSKLSSVGPCQHCNDGRFRRFRPRQASRIARNTLKAVAFALESPTRSDWTTSATRFTESKLVGCARECPGQNARVCGRSADRGPLARATLKRPADRGSFTRTRVKRPADRRSFTGARVKRPADRGTFTRTRVKRPADRGSFTRTRVKRPADRGSFPQAVVKRPADRGTFPPAESLNKLSFSSWTVPAL